MTIPTADPICSCGHFKTMHPFGHSENLVFAGRCMLCACQEFKQTADPPTPPASVPRYLMDVSRDHEGHYGVRAYKITDTYCSEPLDFGDETKWVKAADHDIREAEQAATIQRLTEQQAIADAKLRARFCEAYVASLKTFIDTFEKEPT